MAESEEELKSLLMKEESGRAILKLNIQTTKIMASGPITSWQIDWETMETVSHFIFLGSKITTDGDCSHEIKRRLLLVNIQKMKITASGSITSWQIDWETMETVTDFIFLDLKITADGDCSHEIKRHLLLGRKAMTNLNSILKSRDITLPTKVRLVKAMVFPVVVYGCENWTIKKAEHRRIDAFELWCWRRLLRVPWTARRLNQSILKEINPEY